MFAHPTIKNPFRGVLTATLAFLCANLSAHGPATPPAEDEARRIVFPDTAGYQTLVVDLHTHTAFSDGHVWPKIRVGEALRDGLDAMAVTEHLEYQPHRADIPNPDRNRAFEDTVEAAANADLLVIPGSEITRDLPAGHMNAIFINDANKLLNVENPPADPGNVGGYYVAASRWPAQEAVDAANAQGAFVFWNHPFWGRNNIDGIARINDFQKANMRADKVHGIEVVNGQTYSEEAHRIALKYDLTLIGVSDIHELIDWDYNVADGGHRPVTLAFAAERSMEGLKAALFAKRTVIWFRNLLIGRKPEIDALLSASLVVKRATYNANARMITMVLKNHSDAEFELRNTSDYTFTDYADRIRVPAHGEFELRIKAVRAGKPLKLSFAVENALIGPKQTAVVTFATTPAAG
ncbi:MAG: Sb-PDE family phosphodiesterase [Pseudomonadota bacterium]